MLHHQDQAYGGRGSNSSPHLQSRKLDKDGNFNFLPGRNENVFSATGGDENRNQARPRNQGPMGRDHPGPPRARMPCWTQLAPLPEVEAADDGFGRVPPDGAEERRMEEEDGRMAEEKKKKSYKEDEDEWGDSDSGSDCSASSLNLECGAEAATPGRWDRVGVGEPKPRPHQNLLRNSNLRSGSLDGLPEDGRSSDSDDDMPELMDAVWTLRDRERFKAQEMEKHQVQLTMYRRLALIRWVRTLQGRVEEQQNRLQSTFDVILTHRKELLRMNAAVSSSASTAVAQS